MEWYLFILMDLWLTIFIIDFHELAEQNEIQSNLFEFVQDLLQTIQDHTDNHAYHVRIEDHSIFPVGLWWNPRICSAEAMFLIAQPRFSQEIL